MKKRILLITEATNLCTGFSTYAFGLLTKLHKNPNFECAELGYGTELIPETPWKYFSNHPQSPEEQKVFESNMENKFGAFKFNEVCLTFQPHIVISITDYWMCSWINDSPYRKYFKYIQKAVIDSEPLVEVWINQLQNADLVMPYTNFAKTTMEEQSGNLINIYHTPCGAGVDTETFKPMDKIEARKIMGIDEDIFLVGMSSRNQHRKLYPNLFQAFRKFLDESDSVTRKRSFLYIHTTFPDLGWDFPTLIKRNGLGSKVLFTYLCHTCDQPTASFFKDARSICYRCHNNNCMFPTTNKGVTREQLATIMNTFDIFCQYSTNEGFGMNQVEAASCGIPVMAPDYSGMSDVLTNTGGMAIDILKYDVHIEFMCKRAIPNDESFCRILRNYLVDQKFGLDVEASREARNGVLKYYTWEKVGLVWSDAIDNTPTIPFNKSWGAPPDIYVPATTPPEQFDTIEEFVHWCFVNILNQPEKLDSYFALRLTRDLTMGMRPVTVPGSAYISENSGYGSINNNHVSFNIDQAIQEMIKIRKNINDWETIRVSKIKKEKV